MTEEVVDVVTVFDHFIVLMLVFSLSVFIFMPLFFFSPITDIHLHGVSRKMKMERDEQSQTPI
jgi:hypothetical protein